MAGTLDFSVLWVIQGLLGDLWGKNLTVSLFQVGWDGPWIILILISRNQDGPKHL